MITMKPINIPVQQTRYGKNQIGVPFREDTYSGWMRRDVYTSGKTGEVFPERRFAAGPDDFSPMFIDAYAGDPGNGSYHPKCSCCWLGFSHTLERHNRNAVGSWD